MENFNEEENFMELLEEYLDEEEINSKLQEDALEETKEKAKNQSESVFTVEDAITIDRFVHDYLNIQGDCSKLYHSGLKELESEYVMGVDNNFANKNPELVKDGYLLLVIDAKNNRGTYINPFYLERILNKDEVEKEFSILSKKRVTDLQKLDEYYLKYMDLQQQIENNQKFYKVLEEAHKVKHYKRLVKERRDN